MEKISVIVPVYNVEKYLEKCLISLLNQDYKDFEIILVNDASTDSSLSICNHYAKKSKKIILINLKINQGLSNVRNIGLKRCSGQYVAFVDSDDYVDPKFLSSMYFVIKSTKADLVCCNHFSFRDNEKIFVPVSQNKESFPLSPLEFSQLVFTLKLSKEMGVSFGGFVWNKLFKRDILNEVLFVSTNGAEDELFLSKIFLRINSVYYTGEPLYYYNIRKGSLSQDNSFVVNHLKTRYQIYNDLKLINYAKIAESALYQRLLSIGLCFFSNNQLTIDDLVTFRRIYNEKKHWSSRLLYTEGVNLLILQKVIYFLTQFDLNLTMNIVRIFRIFLKLFRGVRK